MSNKFRTAEEIAADESRIKAEAEVLKWTSNVKIASEAVKSKIAQLESGPPGKPIGADLSELRTAAGDLAEAQFYHKQAMQAWDKLRVRRPRKEKANA